MANGQWSGLKTVVPDNAVTATVDQHCAVYPRLEEAWEALKWLLSRSAAIIGRPSVQGDLRLYVQADDPIANVPAIWVVYRVNDQVEILAIKIVAPTTEEDDS